MEKLLERAHALKDELIAHRRYIHQNAETGFDTPKTKKYITECLEKMGYEPKECGRAGIKAEVGNGNKTILLRADTDALPIKEETSLPYAAAENMHSCGHDMHTAMLLFAAKLIISRREELKQNVILATETFGNVMRYDCCDFFGKADEFIKGFNLISAYNALPTYYNEVDAIVNHVAIEADGTETLIGQQVYENKAAGTTVLAKPASKTPGYEVKDASPQLKLLSGGNATETVTFYYQPVKKQIVLITNNDNADVTTVADVPAGSTVSASSLDHGTKAYFDFVQWVDQDGKVYSSDFKMPADNLTLTAKWIPSEIKISAIPVIDGVERTDLVETYPSIRPNADGTTAVSMQKPADLDIDGSPEEFTTVLYVAGDGRWQAEYNGVPVKVESGIPGCLEMTLPKGSTGKLKLKRIDL